ncbi:hypothetical protein HN937_06000, partial [Candidatus Poribacteria bacterium]|nr:hypothetical protein [Candidatus Poribacteria bacterium]
MTRPLAVALVALIAGFASAQTAADTPAAQHVRALTGRGAAQTAAAIEIAKLRDADADMAIQALLDRNLHTYTDAAGETIAVVAGETAADGRVPLRHAYGGAPVVDAAGAHVAVPEDALTAVTAGRK